MNKAILLGVISGFAAGASAQTMNFDANIGGFGADDPNGNGTGDPALIYQAIFNLPAIESIDNAYFDLSHSYMSDMHLTLESPDGDIFFFAKGRSSDANPPFDAPFDADDLGDGSDSLDGVERYFFAETGSTWNDGAGGTPPAPGDTFASVEWISGPFNGGDWTLSVFDAWDTVDDGALGSLGVNYTVPTPGAVALLGMGGLAALRRRRG